MWCISFFYYCHTDIFTLFRIKFSFISLIHPCIFSFLRCVFLESTQLIHKVWKKIQVERTRIPSFITCSVLRTGKMTRFLLLINYYDRAPFANFSAALNSVFKSSNVWVFDRAHQSYFLKTNLGCFFSAFIVGLLQTISRSAIFGASSSSPPRKHPRNARVIYAEERGPWV